MISGACVHDCVPTRGATQPQSRLAFLAHPAKFAEQDRVLDNRFRLSGLAPAIQHRHRKVHVGCHHPHNALMGRTLTPAARAAAAIDVRSGFSVVPARLMPKVLMLNQR